MSHIELARSRLAAAARTLPILALSSGIPACGGSESGSSPSALAAESVASVEITPSGDILTWLGQTLQLDATPKTADGQTVGNVSVSWSSDDTLVATVDPVGVVTAARNGTTTIRASAGEGSGSSRITVDQTPASVSKVHGDGQAAPAGLALPDSVVVQVTDEGGAPIPEAAVEWTVESGGGVLTEATESTDDSGRAAARWQLGPEEGEQSLKVTVGEVPAVHFSATAEPEVVRSIDISPATDTLVWIGETVQLTATVLGSTGGEMTEMSVAWGAEDTVVAIVDSRGVVTAIGNGSTEVWASAEGFSDTVKIAVQQQPAGIEVVSGDGQVAAPGSELADPLVVRVADQGGTGVPQIPLAWNVTSGGGSILESSGSTDADGSGTARWTLGDSVGVQTVEVTAAELDPVQFSAQAETHGGALLAIDGIQPDPLVEGETGTISGTGLGGPAGDYDVTVAGAAAEIVSTSSTKLEFTVPRFRCAPTRNVTVSVSRIDGGYESRDHVLHPPRIDFLDVGWYQHFTDARSFCLYLAPEDATQTYLVGVQSTSEVPSSVTPATLFSSTGLSTAVTAPELETTSTHLRMERLTREFEPALARREPTQVPQTALAPDEVIEAHRSGEADIRAYEERLIRELGGYDGIRFSAETAALSAPPARVSTPEEGDTVSVRVPESCELYQEVTAVVRKVGQHGVWMEDVENPAEGLSASDISEFSDVFDQQIFAVQEAYFGSPTDLDANGRVSVLISKEVNKMENVLGFVFGVDLLSRTTCPSSDEGEIFYGIAPDPTGIHGREYSTQDVRNLYPNLIAHEVTHVIQQSRRLYISRADGPMSTWVGEGQATLAEEVVGYSVLGLGALNNYGLSVWSDSSPWFDGQIIDLAYYFGFESSSTKIEGAPHECSWVGRPDEGNASPCLNPGRLPYGVPALLFRWTLDHYGGTYPSGHQSMTREMVDHPSTGLSMLESVAGESADRLLARWAMSLYVDDAWFTGGLTTMPSWNLENIFSGLQETAHLEPLQLSSLSGGQRDIDVAAGSTAYFLVTADGRPYTAIGASTPFGSDLPSHMRYWALRLQ